MDKNKIFHEVTHLLIFAISGTIGVKLVLIGEEMLNQKTLAVISNFSFSAGLALLVVGLALIISALIFISPVNLPINSAVKWISKNRHILVLLIVLSFIMFIYSNSHYTLKDGDKYNLLVDLIFIFIGFSAVIGLGIFKWISREVEDRLAEERNYIDKNKLFLSSIIFRNVGYTYWQIFDLSHNQPLDERSKENIAKYQKGLLSNAIKMTEKALEYVESLPEDMNKRETFLCINCLVYYYGEIYKYDIQPLKLSEGKSRMARNLAEKLKHNASSTNFPNEYWRFQESAAWTLYHLSDEKDEARKSNVRNSIEEILQNSDAPEDWREEIHKKWRDYINPV